MIRGRTLVFAALVLVASGAGVGCRSGGPAPGERVRRYGDEIMVAGEMFRVGAPVVLWTDPGGYDAYRVERRFARRGEEGWEDTAASGVGSPNRYGLRKGPVADARFEEIRGGGWRLEDLLETVDQFVLHYDAAGTSRGCFRVLHDVRGLSVHFLLDLDGTIYQTLDLKERAWHATIANDRSIGIEIANIGAYPRDRAGVLERWYVGEDGRTRVSIPADRGDGGIRTPGFVGGPARSSPVVGEVQGTELVQYDFTPEQYESLISLTAALCSIFPELVCDAPRDADGRALDRALTRPEFDVYRGVLGHFHVQENKVDPGPAFQWDMVINGARERLRSSSRR